MIIFGIAILLMIVVGFVAVAFDNEDTLPEHMRAPQHIIPRLQTIRRIEDYIDYPPPPPRVYVHAPLRYNWPDAKDVCVNEDLVKNDPPKDNFMDEEEWIKWLNIKQDEIIALQKQWDNGLREAQRTYPNITKRRVEMARMME